MPAELPPAPRRKPKPQGENIVPLDLMRLWRKLRKKLELTPFDSITEFRAFLLTAKTAVRMSP